MKDIIILAIESSCDETACAIVRNGKDILSNIVSSQISVHKEFGGVIPEVASRIHVENISFVIESAIEQANVRWEEIDAIAIANGPGLVGCLHIGSQAAKTLAFLHDKPLISVHHIAGHIYANGFIEELVYPMMALVVSGGHSELVYLKEANSFEVIGSTTDDAIGEAYDKVARLLGLGYPGGPVIDKLAKTGSPIYPYPKVKSEGRYNFSFSGLKSSTLQLINRLERNSQSFLSQDIAASFQEGALSLLIDRTEKSLTDYQPKMLVLAGGVAANSRLRSLVLNDLQEKFPEIKMVVPPLWCCTDNAAMIAAAGYISYLQNKFTDFSVTAQPNKDLNTY